jgi:hypothetical protein
MNLELLHDGNQNRPTGDLVELTQIFLLKVAFSRDGKTSAMLKRVTASPTDLYRHMCYSFSSSKQGRNMVY